VIDTSPRTSQRLAAVAAMAEPDSQAQRDPYVAPIWSLGNPLRDSHVSMRDGVRLATDVYLPPALPAPAIGVRTPYGREWTRLSAPSSPLRAAGMYWSRRTAAAAGTASRQLGLLHVRAR